MNGSMMPMPNPVRETESAGDDRDDPGSRSSADADEQDQPPERSRASEHSETDLSITLADTAEAHAERVDLAWLEAHIRRLLPLLPRPVERLAVEIVDDARMTHLHEQFCNEESTTDVLTFPASGDDEAVDVDIAVCADEAARRAAERGHDVNRELLLYVLHGLLHCCGFDDHDEVTFRTIHAEEDRLLAAIGVGKIFDGESSGHDDEFADEQRDTGIDG